ncbi:MAG: undecaprenyl-diphosphatase, partial [Verrucomicrobiales bacterium]
MMELWHAIVLGIVQGFTEFLPISSSGHLVLTGELLGVGMDSHSSDGITFAVAVHLGTLLSVLIYFHRRLIAMTVGIFSTKFNIHHKTVLLLIVATIPAVIFGLTLKDQIKSAFESAVLVSCLLIVTGAVLLLPRLFRRAKAAQENTGEMTLVGSIVMGIAQAFAILPGISRSGSTIATGMLAKINPSKAAEFSFFMAIPA